MAKAYIGVGLPGSGKTTYLRELAATVGAEYICADDVRSELYGDSKVQTDPGRIWEIVHTKTRKALMAGRNVVVDGTNIKPQDRLRMIQVCQTAEWIEAIWCQAPFAVCMARNRARSRVVPDHAMRRMSKQLYRTPPTKREGFNRVSRVPTAG